MGPKHLFSTVHIAFRLSLANKAEMGKTCKRQEWLEQPGRLCGLREASIAARRQAAQNYQLQWIGGDPPAANLRIE
jgi:hypothetical protein